jgi:hypothetical protein
MASSEKSLSRIKTFSPNKREQTMTFRQFSKAALAFVILGLAPSLLLAAGGTSAIATKGNVATVSDDWPTGVGDIVNDPLRTNGWNSWFTEWPNDVNQYAFEIKSMKEVNALVEKLAKVKPAIGQIRLSYLKEPSGLGWVTQLPEENNIAVIFSIGDQGLIDAWFKRVRKPFGVMEFNAAPIAVPPTLTLFVQNDAINLDELIVPAGIEVAAGYVPTVFHKSNTTLEQTQDKEFVKRLAAERLKERDSLEPAAKKTADAIDAYLKKRNAAKPE